MATLPLDLDSLLAEQGEDESPHAPAGTRIGHVHLHVADLAAAEEFYAGVLGFDVTVRGYPGALFLSAGGYHHHIGVNTWAGEGAPAPPPGTRGLRDFAIVLPGSAELDAAEGRLRDAGVEARRDAEGVHAADPSGNGIVLTSTQAA